MLDFSETTDIALDRHIVGRSVKANSATVYRTFNHLPDAAHM
jgi:hypothetical protein